MTNEHDHVLHDVREVLMLAEGGETDKELVEIYYSAIVRLDAWRAEIDHDALGEALDKLDRLEKHMNKHGSFGDNGSWDVTREIATLLHAATKPHKGD